MNYNTKLQELPEVVEYDWEDYDENDNPIQKHTEVEVIFIEDYYASGAFIEIQITKTYHDKLTFEAEEDFLKFYQDTYL